MKKVLLLAVFAFVSLMASAQIQRTFFGQTLGVSTKEDVYNSLKSKGAFREMVKGQEAIQFNNARFGGYDWDTVIFLFYHNTFSQILLMDYNKNANQQKAEKIIKQLESKYGVFSDDGESMSYTDGATIIVAYKNKVLIGYTDFKLHQIKKAEEADEF